MPGEAKGILSKVVTIFSSEESVSSLVVTSSSQPSSANGSSKISLSGNPGTACEPPEPCDSCVSCVRLISASMNRGSFLPASVKASSGVEAHRMRKPGRPDVRICPSSRLPQNRISGFSGLTKSLRTFSGLFSRSIVKWMLRSSDRAFSKWSSPQRPQRR